MAKALSYLCLIDAVAYSMGVISCRSRMSAFLRASLLALLVLGIVIKPILASAFELHTADHALSAQGDGGNDRPDADDHDQSGNDGGPGQDHAQGAHGLLHESKCGGAYSDTVAALKLPLAPYQATVIPYFDSSPVASHHVTGQFRPPIA